MSVTLSKYIGILTEGFELVLVKLFILDEIPNILSRLRLAVETAGNNELSQKDRVHMMYKRNGLLTS